MASQNNVTPRKRCDVDWPVDRYCGDGISAALRLAGAAFGASYQLAVELREDFYRQLSRQHPAFTCAIVPAI